MFYKYTHPFGSQYEVAEGLNEDTETPFYNFCVRNKDDLIYFNPYNYPTWMGRSSDAFSSTAGGTDTYGNPRDNNGDSLERGFLIQSYCLCFQDAKSVWRQDKTLLCMFPFYL